jgi:eukaryotic-like serine/threonine-protein kinase
MPIQPGALVAERYRLREVAGRGGMGVVWLATDELLHRDVAVKEIVWPPQLSQAERDVLCQRALREARTAARLSHPGVIRVYDVVEDDGRPWIVMQLVRYPTLKDVVDQQGPLPPRRVARIGLGILDAIAAAHAAGVLHRDVKPGNVLLGPDDEVVLTDFGVAVADGSTGLTTSGVLIGSPAYMAPERARGEPATRAADMWSLGATLYTAVEGRPPFDRPGALAVLTAVVSGQPDPPARAGPLWLLISGLLRKDPAKRLGVLETGRLLRQVVGSGASAAAPRATAPLAGNQPPGTAADQFIGRTADPPIGSDAGPPVRSTADPPTHSTVVIGEPHRPPGRAAVPAALIPGLEPRPQAPPDLPGQAPPPGAGSRPRPGGPSRLYPGGGPRRSRRWLYALAGGVLAAVLVAAAAIALLGGGGGHRTAASGSRHGASTSAQQPASRHRHHHHQIVSPPPPAPGQGGSAAPTPGQGGPSPGASQQAGAPPAPGASGPGPLPAGFTWYHDPTGFSIGVPQGWQVSHQGHLVYVRDPGSGRFLIVDQTSQPKPDPLADWQQQEAARRATYPGYHRIRLEAVRYAQAEKAADWEFTYYYGSVLTHVLNRNILANAHHAYALYWSTPASEWQSSFHFFRGFAATFRPAGTNPAG